MSGALLVYPGDIQIGADSDNPLLFRSRFSPHVTLQNHTPTAGQWVTMFNPLEAADVQADQDQVRGPRPGVLQGATFPTKRQIKMAIRLQDTSMANLRTRIDNLKYHFLPFGLDAHIYPTDEPKWESEISWMGIDGLTAYVIYGRFRQAFMADPREFNHRRTEISVHFDCTEPVIYEIGETTVIIPRQTGATLGTPVPPYFQGTGQSIKPFPVGTVAPTTLAMGVNSEAPPRYRVTFATVALNPLLWIRHQVGVVVMLTQIMGMGNGSGTYAVPQAQDYSASNLTPITFQSSTQTIVRTGIGNPQSVVRSATVGTSWFEIFDRADFLWTCSDYLSGDISITYQRAHWIAI